MAGFPMGGLSLMFVVRLMFVFAPTGCADNVVLSRPSVTYWPGPFSTKKHLKLFTDEFVLPRTASEITMAGRALCLDKNYLSECDANHSGHVVLALDANGLSDGRLRTIVNGNVGLSLLVIVAPDDCHVRKPRMLHNRGHVNLKCENKSGVRILRRVGGLDYNAASYRLLMPLWVGKFEEDQTFSADKAYMIDTAKNTLPVTKHLQTWDDDSHTYLAVRLDGDRWEVDALLKDEPSERTPLIGNPDGVAFSIQNPKGWLEKLDSQFLCTKNLCVLKAAKSTSQLHRQLRMFETPKVQWSGASAKTLQSSTSQSSTSQSSTSSLPNTSQSSTSQSSTSLPSTSQSSISLYSKNNYQPYNTLLPR